MLVNRFSSITTYFCAFSTFNKDMMKIKNTYTCWCVGVSMSGEYRAWTDDLLRAT